MPPDPELGDRTRRERAPVRRAFEALALLVAGLALATGIAWAHGALKSSAPARGARLREAPREIRLTFTERVELSMTSIELRALNGEAVPLAPLRAVVDSPQVVIAPVAAPLTAGTYAVAWQVTSRDGHPVRGRFAFTILPGAVGLASTDSSAVAGADSTRPGTPGGAAPRGEAAAAAGAPGQPPPPAEPHAAAGGIRPSGAGFDADSPAYVAIRAIQYAALLLVVGAVAFHLLVLGSLRRTASTAAASPVAQSTSFVDTADGAAARLGLAAAVVVALAAVARLAAQSVALHGAERALEPELVATMLRRTVWGWGWLLQAASATLALAAFALAGRGAARRGETHASADRGWPLATVAAGVLAMTPALSGHAAAARFAPLAVVADWLHVLGAGAWLGGLAVVVAVGVPTAMRLDTATRDRAVADLVHAFSPTALAFASLVAATGVLASWLHLGHVAALWQSDYGRTLLLKLALVAAVVAAGAYNWRRVRPALGGGGVTGRLRRATATELAVAALVLAATAVLVATPPPEEGAGGVPVAAHPGGP